MNKKKIFNDPVYGFITIPHPLLFDLIEHPWFQRLRRIRQLGLAHMVYPGALHTRFHHALGALHLMTQAIETLRSKGHEITDEEALGVQIAILLHDIGHSPFSHALENSFFTGITHEEVSLLFMEALNVEFNGQLTLAISIFRNQHNKHFLHQLVSSQLDMDRLDYLTRDSFYTGVLEGKIGAQRIIKMLDIFENKLVVEEKGIYSIEKFIIARRLMYWQVYLHKTVLATEQLLINILKRAKELTARGVNLDSTPVLHYFLSNTFSGKDFKTNPDLLNRFSRLDDYDIYASIKTWADHEDIVLSRLCNGIINRKLYKIRLQNDSFKPADLTLYHERALKKFNIKKEELFYFANVGSISNSAYDPSGEQICIQNRDGSLLELTTASDQFDMTLVSSPVKKHFLYVLPELIV